MKGVNNGIHYEIFNVMEVHECDGTIGLDVQC